MNGKDSTTTKRKRKPHDPVARRKRYLREKFALEEKRIAAQRKETEQDQVKVLGDLNGGTFTPRSDDVEVDAVK